MALVPMESLVAILDIIRFRQSERVNRLTLAIPASHLLVCCPNMILVCVLMLLRYITVSEGLFLTLDIPLASKQTVFSLCEAKLIPMFSPDDPETALTWNMDAPFLAFSENTLELYVLSVEQFEYCLGSSKYRICFEVFPTQIGHPSRIATL